MQFSKNKTPLWSCLRVFTDLSKPNNVRCVSTASAYARLLTGQSVDLSDIQALGSVYVSLERR